MTEPDEDIPMTQDELALAERGAALVAAAMVQPEAQAPQALREALDRAASARPAPPRRFGLTRGRLLGAGAGVAAVVVAAIVALGGGGDATAPGFDQVAAVGRLPALQGPPAAAGGAMPALDARVGELAFPDWTEAFGWSASGKRTDQVGGRPVTTVFYTNAQGATLGYSIVDGAPVSGAPAGRDVRRATTSYRVARRGDRTLVTWTQDGHTCIIDAPATVPDAKLVALASWANV